MESSEIGSIGVGEATVPAIVEYFREVGLDPFEVMRASGATVKLGIEFDGWRRAGESFFHPFGLYGATDRGVPFHQYWLKLRQAGDNTPLGAYSACTALAYAGRFALPSEKARADLEFYRWALHFDAGLYANYLRGFATQVLGVRRIDAKIVAVRLRPTDGFIECLQLDTGAFVPGDLFVDCAGFRALLIGGALGVGYEDWSDWLPCDRAVAVPCARTQSLTPYTRSTAREAGWQWRIPLQHRAGNGYVYCSRYISDDEATSQLLQSLEGEALAEPNLIRFPSGLRKRFWEKNCIAVGLAAGFMEPLESTGLTLIQSAAEKLVNLFPDADCSKALAMEFNRTTTLEYERIRDFLVLHYVANARESGPFWQECRALELPERLAHKMFMFRDSGRLVQYEWETFLQPSWLSLFAGLEVLPRVHDPRADFYSVEEIRGAMARMREDVRGCVARALPIAEFISRYCASEQSS